jgi:hypothetical protein
MTILEKFDVTANIIKDDYGIDTEKVIRISTKDITKLISIHDMNYLYGLVLRNNNAENIHVDALMPSGKYTLKGYDDPSQDLDASLRKYFESYAKKGKETAKSKAHAKEFENRLSQGEYIEFRILI